MSTNRNYDYLIKLLLIGDSGMFLFHLSVLKRNADGDY